MSTCLAVFLIWSVRLSVNRDTLEKGEAEDGYLPLFERHVPLKACRLPHPCQELNPRLVVLLYLHLNPVSQDNSYKNWRILLML